MRYHVIQGERRIVVELDDAGDGVIRARIDGELVEAEIRTVDGAILISAGGRRLEIVSGGAPPRLQLWTGEGDLQVEVLDDREALAGRAGAASAARSEREIRSPMPGRVVKVLAAPGDSVTKGQGLVVVEAMKMENELAAPATGKVRAVHVEAGKTVESGQVLVEIE